MGLILTVPGYLQLRRKRFMGGRDSPMGKVLYNPDDLSNDHQHSCKNPGVAYAYSPCDERWRQEGPGCLLDNQSSQLACSMFCESAVPETEMECD